MTKKKNNKSYIASRFTGVISTAGFLVGLFLSYFSFVGGLYPFPLFFGIYGLILIILSLVPIIRNEKMSKLATNIEFTLLIILIIIFVIL